MIIIDLYRRPFPSQAEAPVGGTRVSERATRGATLAHLSGYDRKPASWDGDGDVQEAWVVVRSLINGTGQSHVP